MRSISITESNHRRLQSLLATASKDGRNREVVQNLEGELNRAHVLPTEELPADEVTMHSKVRILDIDGREELMFIGFPWRSKSRRRQTVRFLAPLGTAVLAIALVTMTRRMPKVRGDSRLWRSLEVFIDQKIGARRPP